MDALAPLDPNALDDRDFVAFDARRRWLVEARAPKRRGKQIPPDDLDWQILLFLAGRGFGKTYALSQWLWWELWLRPGTIGHIVAPTISDVRGTNFKGPAGLQAVIPAECLKASTWEKAYNETHRELRLANGALIRGFGAVEEASRLRGPQCHRLIADELREFDRPAGNLEAALNNALFGLRLNYKDGIPARAVMGTTPKPIPFLKRFMKREGVRVVTGTSYENLANLSETYRNQLLAMAGTLMGRQEIDGAFIDEESDLSIIKRHWIKLWPADKKLPELQFIIVSLDTAYGEHNYDAKKQTTDPTACLILGVFNVRQVFTADEIKRLGIRCKHAALVLDSWAERLGFPDLLEKVRAQSRIKWGTPGKMADIHLIEEKASGKSLRQMLAEYSVPTWPYNPGRQTKTTRMHAIAPLIAQGMLFVPESARADRKGLPRDWCEELLEQVCAFAGPGSVEHDDHVDALSQALLYLQNTNQLHPEPKEPIIDYEMKIAEDQEKALRLRDEEQRRERGNPYG